MLVLSRDRGETICIGGNIRITVLQNYGSSVRLGIEAPKHISVHREEIYDAIQTGEPVQKKPSQPPKVVTLQDRMKARAESGEPATDARCQGESTANESLGTVR